VESVMPKLGLLYEHTLETTKERAVDFLMKIAIKTGDEENGEIRRTLESYQMRAKVCRVTLEHIMSKNKHNRHIGGQS